MFNNRTRVRPRTYSCAHFWALQSFVSKFKFLQEVCTAICASVVVFASHRLHLEHAAHEQHVSLKIHARASEQREELVTISRDVSSR